MAVNPYDGAGYGCGIGYGYCGTPASGALDILASVGTSTSPTSATTKKITLPFEAKAFLPFGARLETASASTTALLGVGATDGTTDASVAVSSINGVTTSDTGRRHVGNKCVSIISGGTTTEEASQSLIESDGITLNWSSATAFEYIYNHIALGGADLEVKLTQHQMNATNADESFAHGLSGAPTGVLFFGVNREVAPPNTTAHADMSIGAWSSSGQFSSAVYSQSARTTTLCSRTLRNDSCLCRLSIRAMAIDSVDAANVNVTYPVTVVAVPYYFWMLAIRGAKVKVGTFDCLGSTSALPIASGMTPVAMSLINIPTGVDSINTLQNNAHLGIGWSDGTNNVSCGITDENGRISGTNARRFQDSDDLAQYDVAGTEKFRARVTFSGENAIITPTVCNDGWDQGAYIIIGK